jgi:hypothetical protein
LQLLAELNERCALAAFVSRGLSEGGDEGVGLEEFADAEVEDFLRAFRFLLRRGYLAGTMRG